MKAQIATHADFVPERATHSPAYQAYQILHWAFVAAPLVAGLDKFFMRLTDWTQYLWRPAANVVGGPRTFMTIVGVIEIVAAVLVAVKPKIGGYVVAGWLCGIIINLLLIRNYYDVALRDFGLMLGAIALGRLACQFERVKIEAP